MHSTGLTLGSQFPTSRIREQDFFNTANPRRDYTCMGQFDGFGDVCTRWELDVLGDNHLLDYKTRVTATCFEY